MTDKEEIQKRTEQATEKMQKQQFGEAAAEYEALINECDTGCDFYETDRKIMQYCYGHCLAHLALAQSGDEKEATIQKIMAIARKSLSMIPDDTEKYNEYKDLHDDIIKISCNALAWYLYERNELTEALACIERAVPLIIPPRDHYINDTYVRILLALDKEDKAFYIVDNVLAETPDFSNFLDLKSNKDFLAWKELKEYEPFYKIRSAIILKDRIYMPDVHSYENLLEELQLEDRPENSQTAFVKVSVRIKNHNVFDTPIDQWIFTVDQLRVPGWFNKKDTEEKVMALTKEWAAGHIHFNKSEFTIENGFHHIKNCFDVKGTNVSVDICNSTMNAYGKSHINAYGDSGIYAYDNCKVYGYGGDCIVWGYGNSDISPSGGCKVYAHENCIVDGCGLFDVVAWGNSTVKASGNADGDYPIVNAYDHSNAHTSEGVNVYADGDSKVIAENSTVWAEGKSSVIASGRAVVVARGNSVVEATEDATVYAFQNTVIEAKDYSTVIIPCDFLYDSAGSIDNIIIKDDATIKDCNTHTIYQCGDWEIKSIKNE